MGKSILILFKKVDKTRFTKKYIPLYTILNAPSTPEKHKLNLNKDILQYLAHGYQREKEKEG